MSSSSYLLFLHGAREQLQLLRQASTRSHCVLLLNRGVNATFTRRWFGKSTSVSTGDSGENSDTSESFNVSKVGHRKAQRVKQDVDIGFIEHANTKKQSLYKGSKKKTATVGAGGAAEYFRQSWLKHYTSVSSETDPKPDEISPQAHATTTLTEEKEVQRNRRRGMSDFGELSGIVKKDKTISSKPKDMRNPNERIGEALPEDVDEKRDRRLDIPLTRTGRLGKDAYYYTRKISKLGRQGKIREVLDVFEYWMMVRDRVMPRERTFVILIGIMANVGYTDKAFELYAKMNKLGFEVNERIYTSLFNACANCPDPAEGLRRAENLLQYMKRHGILPNLYTVKAAMKAVALCGDFSRAFALMDEASSRLRIDSECFDHLLMACISDKEAGFRRALQVWQRMGDYRVRPQLSTFNHLIRSARDCGIGDLNSFCSALGINISDGVSSAELPLLAAGSQHPDHSRYSDKTYGRRDSLSLSHSIPKAVLVDGIKTTAQLETEKKQKSNHDNHGTPVDKIIYSEGNSEHSDLNNLRQKVVSHGARDLEWWEDEPKGSGWNKTQDISSSELSISKPTSDLSHEATSTSKSLYSEILTENQSSLISNYGMNKLSLEDLTYPHGRLTLLGGAEKIVSFMEEQGLEPELKTYAQLLACLPPNEESEFLLLTMMEERGVKPDIDFFNDIMTRRSRRHKKDTVKAVLPVIAKLRLTPNMRTYAALAQTCRKEKQAHELLQNMKEASLEPNAAVMYHLLCASGSNFVYKQHMLEAMESMGIKPSKTNIAAIEESIAFTKRRMVEAEKNPHEPNFYSSRDFQRSFQNFLNFYHQWLERNELEKLPHPWNSFKRQEPDSGQIPITAESQSQ